MEEESEEARQFFLSLPGQDSDFSGPVERHLVVKRLTDQQQTKFSAAYQNWECRVKGLDQIPFENTPRAIYVILRNLLDRVLRDYEPQDKVRLRFASSGLKSEIWTPLIAKSQLTVHALMLDVERVITSNESFRLDETFELSTQVVKIPYGAAATNVPALLQRKLTNKRSIIQVKNDDQICLARALVIGKALADNNSALQRKLSRSKPNPYNLRDKTLQTNAAKKLIRRVQIPIRPYDLADVQLFQDYLTDYQIIVVGVEQLNSIIFSGPPRPKRILLLHHNNHFDVMKTLSAWFRSSYYCFHCSKAYGTRAYHRCVIVCKLCLRDNCPRDADNVIPCTGCNRNFLGSSCYASHKRRFKGRMPNCQRFFVCSKCRVFVSMQGRKEGSVHRCGEFRCPTCQVWDMPGHICWMRKEELTPKILEKYRNAKFLFFDLETYKDENGKYIPNYAVVQDDEGNQQSFPEDLNDMGSDITKQLCDYLFHERYKGYFIVAHNFRGFDGYWVADWLLENSILPNTIFSGTRIMQLDVAETKTKFRDSLSYVPLSLAAWGVAMGLKNTKQYFPHDMNSSEYWGKVIPFPNRKYYGYEAMTKTERKKFLKFYRKERKRCHNRFDVNATIASYCAMDVTVLRQCSQAFREMFMRITDGICPFSASLTIASLVHYFWRTTLLKPDQIALVHRPTKRENSQKARKWLSYMSQRDKVQIDEEERIHTYYVDGLCKASKTVYEFYGCYWHGHSTHISEDAVSPQQGQTMGQLYRRTLERQEELQKKGFRVVGIWECAYDARLKTDAHFRRICDACEPRPRLQPRDSLYGGRTNAMRLEYMCKPGERILYKDVVSEYPYVNKYKRYPVGPYQRITRDFEDISKYFGLFYGKVLPPTDLFFPVLPYRTDKLTFPLCGACAKAQNSNPCHHTADERALVGTWTTVELLKALEFGYIILDTYEIWHYADSVDGLFAPYVDKFLALKVEASGWPKGVETAEQKQTFIDDFIKREGVHLNAENVKWNPGMRMLAKLCLNSFWGRFGMRDNFTKTVFIKDPAEFFRFVTSTEFTVHSFHFFSDDVLTLTYSSREEFLKTNPKTNVILAAMTTAYARLHLLQFLMDRGQNVLYMDTDSVIYIQKDGEVELPTGSMLGELTDELDPDDYIVKWVCLAPKCYAYVTSKAKSCVKCKGFTISRSAAKLVNFNSLQNIVHNPEETSVMVTTPFNIVRNKSKMEVRCVSRTKRLRATYTKRVILSDLSTLPYGHKDIPAACRSQQT